MSSVQIDAIGRLGGEMLYATLPEKGYANALANP